MWSLPRKLATNPLILGCVAGLVVNLAHLRLPAALLDTAGILGQAALATGMLRALPPQFQRAALADVGR